MSHDAPLADDSSANNASDPVGAPRRAMRNAALAAAVAVLIFGVLWLKALGGTPAASDADADLPAKTIQEFKAGSRPSVGDFTGQLLDGSDFKSTTLRGRVVVYNLWGSWCAPCRKEVAALAAVAKANTKNVTFLGITVRDNLASARAFEKRFQVPYSSISPDTSSKALLALGKILNTAAIPSTLVLDREGRVAARVIGIVTEPTLRALVARVVTEQG